jgi:hypothetical protein
MENNAEFLLKISVPKWEFCNSYEEGEKTPRAIRKKYPCGFMHKKEPCYPEDYPSYSCVLFGYCLRDRSYGIVEKCNRCLELSKKYRKELLCKTEMLAITQA